MTLPTGRTGTVRDSLRRRAATGRRALEIAELTAGCVLVGAILVLVVLQAAQRYLPAQGWVWTGELARYALVWLTFVLAGYLTGRGEHISLEVVDYLVRGRVLAVVKRFADGVVAAVAAAFMVDAWNLVATSADGTSPAVGIPLQWVYMVPLAGFALTAVRAGWAAVAGRPAAPAGGSLE